MLSGTDYDYIHKIILIGDHGVGKTQFINQFCKNEFNESYLRTMNNDFSFGRVKFDNKTVGLQLWDPTKIEDGNLRGAHAVIFMYDVTDKESFDNISEWIIKANNNFSENIIFLLVGNKVDLAQKKVVDYDTAKAFADKNDICFLECSAKCRTNVDKAFLTISAEVYNKQKEHFKIYKAKNNTQLEELAQALTGEITKYRNIVKSRCGRRQSSERLSSINILQKSITELHAANKTKDEKLVEFIGFVKGHINATLADHRNACCFGFFKLFTKPDLVRAYQNVLDQLPKKLVDSTEAKVIDLDESSSLLTYGAAK